MITNRTAPGRSWFSISVKVGPSTTNTSEDDSYAAVNRACEIILERHLPIGKDRCDELERTFNSLKDG